MRFKAWFVIGLVLGFSSCKNEMDPQILTRTWKPKNQAALSSYSSISFFNKDSVIARTYDYGRLSSEVSGTYRIDPKSSILTTSYGDSISYELEIKTLSSTELELYYLKTKQSQHYLRAD